MPGPRFLPGGMCMSGGRSLLVGKGGGRYVQWFLYVWRQVYHADKYSRGGMYTRGGSIPGGRYIRGEVAIPEGMLLVYQMISRK